MKNCTIFAVLYWILTWRYPTCFITTVHSDINKINKTMQFKIYKFMYTKSQYYKTKRVIDGFILYRWVTSGTFAACFVCGNGLWQNICCHLHFLQHFRHKVLSNLSQMIWTSMMKRMILLYMYSVVTLMVKVILYKHDFITDLIPFVSSLLFLNKFFSL